MVAVAGGAEVGRRKPGRHHTPRGRCGWPGRLRNFAGRGLERLRDRPDVGSLLRLGEGTGLPRALDSDPSHEASKWSKTALLCVGRDPRELEDFVRNLGIEFR